LLQIIPKILKKKTKKIATLTNNLSDKIKQIIMVKKIILISKDISQQTLTLQQTPTTNRNKQLTKQEYNKIMPINNNQEADLIKYLMPHQETKLKKV
jgi:hypothetical protein